MAHNYKEAAAEAKALLPLDLLLSSKYGLGTIAQGTKAEIKKEPCPFCGRLGKFGLFKRTDGVGGLYAKCFVDTCRANHALDESGFVQLKDGFPDGQEGRAGAFYRWLEYAGVTIHRTPAPEAHPGKLFKPTNPEALDSVATSSIVNQTVDPDKGAIIKFPAKDPDASQIWSVLHSRLVLTASDQHTLEKKRGFPEPLVVEHGLKSGNAANTKIIEGLREVFPDHQLLESGLFVLNRSRDKHAPRIVPERQFCGLGITAADGGVNVG